jgi:hypothetical protein
MFLTTLGLYSDSQFIKLNYFLIMWWAWIITLIGYFVSHDKALPWLYRKDFINICLSSIFIWTFFEAYNLVLNNWIYVNIDPQPPLRWLGYSLSFATVIPGIFLAMQLLYPKLKSCDKKRRLFKGWEIFSVCVGLTCAIAPLCYPNTCFALVWLAFIFLPEPFLYHSSYPSLVREYEKGDDRRLTALLFAGFLTGFLWECWNWKAGSKWVYTLPFFDDKLFEMPFAGFLGFPPFAVECWVLHQCMVATFNQLKNKYRYCLGLSLVILVLVVYYQMDIHTVKS